MRAFIGLMILFCIVAIMAAYSTSVAAPTLPAPDRQALMVSTSGVIVGPVDAATFKSANGIGGSTATDTVARAAIAVLETGKVDVLDWQNSNGVYQAHYALLSTQKVDLTTFTNSNLVWQSHYNLLSTQKVNVADLGILAYLNSISLSVVTNAGTMAAESTDDWVPATRTLTFNGVQWNMGTNGSFSAVGETNILEMSTAELDTDKVLKPDGAGGVVWGTDSGGTGSVTSVVGDNTFITNTGSSASVVISPTASTTQSLYKADVAYGWGDHSTAGYAETASLGLLAYSNSLTAANVGAVPSNRTLTINGVVWTMNSNGTFTVSGGSGNPVDSRAVTNTIDMAGHSISNAATVHGTNGVFETLTVGGSEVGTNLLAVTNAPGVLTSDGTNVSFELLGDLAYLDSIPLSLVTNAGTMAAEAADDYTKTADFGALAFSNSLTAANVGAVPTTRTVTVNGVTGTLNSNVSFTVTAGVSTNLFTGAGSTGLVTSTSSDTNKFLRGDATWQSVVPTSRTLTIDGTTYDLSANRSWTTSGGGGAAVSNLFWATMGGTNQASITDDAATKVTFKKEVYDSKGWYDAANSKCTVQQTGHYMFRASMLQTETTVYGTAFIYVNGAVRSSGTSAITRSVNDGCITVMTGPLLLNSNDYVEVYIDAYTGSGVTISGNTNHTIFAGWKFE